MTFSDLVTLKRINPKLIERTPYLAKWTGGGAIWAKTTTVYNTYNGLPSKTSTYHVGYKVKIIKPGNVDVAFEALLVCNGKSLNLICCNVNDKFERAYNIGGMSLQSYLKKIQLQNPDITFSKRTHDKTYLKRIEKCIVSYMNGSSPKLVFDWSIE